MWVEVHKLGVSQTLQTFPALLKHHYGGKVAFSTLINWAFSIIPIWFIGMTLYQRIYAAKSEKEAKQAWFIAGLFEYPVMAFLGVALGILAKVSFDSGLLPTASLSMIDPESAMPMMLKQVLPIGALGLIMAAFFSAILSTADSCLMASSGNICLDLFSFRKQKKALRMSQIMTFVIGFVAVLLAMFIPSVLDLMLMSYAFMVSGLTAPVLGILWYKKPSPRAALSAMSMGSLCLLILQLLGTELPMGLDPVVPGLLISIVVFGIVQRAETISA